MKKRNLFLFILMATFLLSSLSPLLMAQPINDDPKDEFINNGPWKDPWNGPDFFLGNTEEFSIQNVFINGRPLNPSVYFFSIHREVFVPVRIVTYALGGKVYWEPVKRKVFINGKELNTTRVILGPNCYVSLRSIAPIFNAQVAYDTKNHSAAIWSKHPAELGYPIEKWYVGTSEYYQRLHAKIKAQQENAKFENIKAQLEQEGITGVDETYIKNYVQTKGDNKQQNVAPTGAIGPVPPPVGPTPPPVVVQPPPVAPPVTTPPPASPTPKANGNPFNFGF